MTSINKEIGKCYVSVEPDFTALREGLEWLLRALDVIEDKWQDGLESVKPETVENILGEAIQFGHHADTGTRLEGVIADYAERIRKAVDGPSNGHLWVSETEYNSLVDAAGECQKWRDECKKLGEQLDRLRNDEGVA